MMPSTYDSADGKRCANCNRLATQLPSGEVRCRPCRSKQRIAERDRADNQRTRTHRMIDLRNRAQRDDAELSEDEWRQIVETDGPDAVDCGDDFALAVRIGAVTVSTADLVQADTLWATGQAKQILKRAGVTTKAFAEMVGVSPRQVAYWLSGSNLPKASKLRAPAAAALLAHKAGNDGDDIILRAHGLEPTLAASNKFDGHEPYETDEPWRHCDGCKRARQLITRQYA